MKANFKPSLAAVLKHEGGYVNHPKDPGGATNFGITQAVYDAWNGEKSRSVKFIEMDEVEAIYRKQYWDVVRGDELPSGVDYCVFDFAVNSGPARAAKYLQTEVGAVADGQIGPATIAAAKDADPRATINGICDRRMAFLKGLSTWPTFGKGWSSRVAGVRAMAIDMAGQANKTSGVSPEAKDPIPDAPKVDVTDAGHNIAAIVLGALGALIAAVAAFIGFGR